MHSRLSQARRAEPTATPDVRLDIVDSLRQHASLDPFVLARNPDPESSLPYLLRLPIEGGIILKAKADWPRASRVYCHPLEVWPDDAEVIEEVAVKLCHRQQPQPVRVHETAGTAGDLLADGASGEGCAPGSEDPQAASLRPEGARCRHRHP